MNTAFEYKDHSVEIQEEWHRTKSQFSYVAIFGSFVIHKANRFSTKKKAKLNAMKFIDGQESRIVQRFETANQLIDAEESK